MAPLLQTTCKNQKQFQREDLFFEIIMLWGQKINKTWTDSNRRPFFLEIIMFLGQKINKIATDSKLSSFFFIIRSSVVSIKFRFDHVSF